MRQVWILISILLMELIGCASAPRNSQVVSGWVPHQVRMRRPSGPGADPQAAPGGVDYRSSPLPDERFDCEETAALFRSGIVWDEVTKCLESLKTGRARYVLRRDFQPQLVLDPEDDENPECLKKALPTIPVPREIFFQSQITRASASRLECFSARLPLEADRVMDVRLPVRKWVLKVEFPLDPVPQNEDTLARTLTSWALTPFFGVDAQESRLSVKTAKVVSDRICRQCFGEKNLLEPDAPVSPEQSVWPLRPQQP